MSKFYVGKDLVSFSDNGTYKPVSRVTLMIDDENCVTAGDDTGMELTATCYHATQAMADTLLAQFKGYEYPAFEAVAANLDPAAELGDGITADGHYSVISRLSDDGSGYPSPSAPGEAELDDEFPSTGPMSQEFNRKIAQTNSKITKTAEEIRLEVATFKSETNKSLEDLRSETDGALAELEETLGKEIGDLSDSFNMKLESYSTITQTDSKIAAAVKTSAEYTDSETGKVVASLEKYSTIEQTDDKISTAVSDSKEYTDAETGKVVASLSNYSTIEQTDSKISTAVSESKSYTDKQVEGLSGDVDLKLESYSTIEQTTSKIATAVSESKSYTDTETGKVISSLSNYSTIEQTASSISLAVSGLIDEEYAQTLIDQSIDKIELSVSSEDGSTTFTLTGNGAELCAETLELSVNAVNIAGKLTADQIDATDLVLTNSANIANNFIVDSSGNVTMNGNLDLSGASSITWSSANSPIKYQYSVDGVSNWHDTMTSDDKYRRESYDGGNTWSVMYQFVGTDGKDGADGWDGSDANVTYANILTALKKAYGVQTTFITADSAGSPNIYGGNIYGANFYGTNFNIVNEDSQVGSFNIYDSSGECAFEIYYVNGDSPNTHIYSPWGGYLHIGRGGATFFPDTVYFNGAVDFDGTVDISGATMLVPHGTSLPSATRAGQVFFLHD